PSSGSCTRSPVGVSAGTVKRSFGNGRRHAPSSIGSQVPAPTAGCDAGLADPAAGPATDPDVATRAHAAKVSTPSPPRADRFPLGSPSRTPAPGTSRPRARHDATPTRGPGHRVGADASGLVHDALGSLSVGHGPQRRAPGRHQQRPGPPLRSYLLRPSDAVL